MSGRSGETGDGGGASAVVAELAGNTCGCGASQNGQQAAEAEISLPQSAHTPTPT
jgi:hypothetical protein